MSPPDRTQRRGPKLQAKPGIHTYTHEHMTETSKTLLRICFEVTTSTLHFIPHLSAIQARDPKVPPGLSVQEEGKKRTKGTKKVLAAPLPAHI